MDFVDLSLHYNLVDFILVAELLLLFLLGLFSWVGKILYRRFFHLPSLGGICLSGFFQGSEWEESATWGVLIFSVLILRFQFGIFTVYPLFSGQTTSLSSLRNKHFLSYQKEWGRVALLWSTYKESNVEA